MFSLKLQQFKNNIKKYYYSNRRGKYGAASVV